MQEKGLYDARLERDACGIGAVINIDGHKSHGTVDEALRIVEHLEHRAGKDADGKTGDGVGILMQVPHELFHAEAAKCGIELGEEGEYGVGMCFFPTDPLRCSQAKKMLEIIARKEGVPVLGWREVPVRPEILGSRAADCMPHILQCFLKKPDSTEKGLAFDRELYLVRRTFEQSSTDAYVASMSSRTVVYKGMFLVGQLREFYPDLTREECKSALAMVHSRFSTNTMPSWKRAHPNRMILHNGEINTIRGNADRMLAREETMTSELVRTQRTKVFPVINGEGSDSAMLDNVLEFLVMNGVELPLAVMMTIPEPWRHDDAMSREKRDFYHYYSTMMEPWDGPAAILFSDGDVAGAVLDRNGLRPARYWITDDGRLILSSETGVLDVEPEHIVCKDRLRPGKMLLVDTKEGRLVTDEECKARYAASNPYGEWLDTYLVRLSELAVPNRRPLRHSQDQRDRLYKAFGYTYEDVRDSILPMARTGSEATASMGADIPLAVLSECRPPLFDYFRQMFAQVTNPPIDAIREQIVTDTHVYVGSDGNLLEEKPENCRVLQIENPILTAVDLMKIRAMKRDGFRTETISLLYYKNTPLERALELLFVDCDRAYRDGANILILSDRGVDENHLAIPSLLAVSALEQYLVRTKKRTAVSIILESGEPRDVHHFATLLGYGARAIHPYLAHECIEELIDRGVLDKDGPTAIDDYNSAILHGIVKIAAKMGVSTLQSYQSSQIFEAVGIRKDVIDRYFTNTISRVGGIGLDEIGEDVEFRHGRAFDPLGLDTDTTLDSVGMHKLRSGSEKEDHMYDPKTIALLRAASQTGNYNKFREYTARVDDEKRPHTLRGLLEFAFPENGGIPLEEVEPEEEIVKRFKTGAMSYGSISGEAHECLAEAMNRLGGKSNSGEGGERPERLGTEKNSAIKQVASGRFGVTSEYLVSAQEIQIKMAQGAKPGEGGHLPGNKVYPWIAKTRHSTPGVPLISPPPHHDIYSIEDLAQLIYDLKNANDRARISVKLVSEAGVGTVAAGVAKAGAQVILISGCDGGTGAAPKSSIHHAGLPWELGIAEAHQTLLENGLRSRVVLETDGKLMSGRDVAVAAILGAEEFGFATAPLVTLGCVMMRVCNLDTCPCGVATQNPELRARFCGKPEYVMNFMRFVAREVREIMAKLGVRTIGELVGRTDLLRVRESDAGRAATLDLSRILAGNPEPESCAHFREEDVYNFHLENTLDEKVLLPAFRSSLNGGPKKASVRVTNTDRTLGTLLGAEITRRLGTNAPEDSFTVECLGSGGQSFGAFAPKGLTILLEGDANDGIGKGLSGGCIAVFPPRKSRLGESENVIAGNVALYGATSGSAFLAGTAGERFCVRNSGATAVVEGVGDHGCEYMTGGRVAVLGPTGKNFAAGMSGGVAYVLDEKHDFYRRLNKELVTMTPVTEKHDAEELRAMIEEHVKRTGSRRGAEILEHFSEMLPLFKKVMPNDYRRMLTAIGRMEEKGLSRDQAELEAFYAVCGR